VTKATRASFLAASLPLALATGFLILVRLTYGPRALLLAFQDLGFGPFQVLLLPASVFAARQALSLAGWRKLSPRERRCWTSILAALLLGVFLMSWRDARRAPSPPYARKDAQEVDTVHALRRSVLAASDPRTRADSLRDQFVALPSTQGFSSASDFVENASALGWYALALNILAFSYAVALFIYLVFRSVHPPPASTTTKRLNNLVLAVAALTLWFPLRVFSEWFNNFYSLDLTEFRALLPILLALISSIGLLARIARPETFEKWWKITTTIVGLIIGLAAYWNPEALFPLAAFTFNLDLLTWAFSVLVGGVGLFGLAKTIAALP
jgi:hypothetical protein